MGKVLQHHLFARAPQLSDGGEELLFIPSAERSRFVVDQDGPINVSGRHGSLYKAGPRIAGRQTSTLLLEPLQFFDEGCAFEAEEACGVTLVAVRAIERLLNQLPLDTRNHRDEIEPHFRQRD